MDYWYLGVGGSHVRMVQDAWGYWTNDEGQPVNVDNAGNVTDESGNWLGTIYGDTTNFLSETRDQLLDIPADALNRAAITIPVTIAVTGLIVVWYFFRK